MQKGTRPVITEHSTNYHKSGELNTKPVVGAKKLSEVISLLESEMM